MIDRNRTEFFILLRKVTILLVLLVIILTLSFIWGNSMKNVTQSSNQSNTVYEEVYEEIVKNPAESVVGTNVISPKIIRKLAHVLEFFCLGIEINLMYFLIDKYTLKNLPQILSLGLLVGALDEFIQIFFDRGSQVQDVFIDFIGYALATTLFLLVYYSFKKIKIK